MSEDARGHFPSKMERFSDVANGGWQCKVDLSTTTVVVPSELESYEAHVEGMLNLTSYLLVHEEMCVQGIHLQQWM